MSHSIPRVFRGCAIAIGGVGLSLLAACGSEQSASTALGTSSAAVVGGAIDVDTDEANAVVRLSRTTKSCTATLLTPRLAITAAHCVSDNQCASIVQTGSLRLGFSSQSPRLFRQPPSTAFSDPSWDTTYFAARAASSRCINSTTSGNDIALVYLAKSELTPKSRRPSFNPRVGTGSVTLSNVSFAGWSPVGQPGIPLFRQYSDMAEADMSRSSGQQGFYWEHSYEPSNGQTRAGDSGGPLYYTDPDGTRDVIGVLSSGADNMNPELSSGDETWADITRGSNKDWVLANALDSTINGGHTSAWRASHAKGTDFWYGEVDYVGSCRKDVDDDCDGWFDKGAVVHDNCPYVPNAEQEDSNDDGIGDACQLCPWDAKNDEDGDGVCADGPKRPPNAPIDNCPKIKNPGQENCNADSEVQRARVTGQTPVILGDVCDPVPCPKVLPTTVTTTVNPGTGYDPEIGGVVFSRSFMDRVKPTPIPSHQKTATTPTPATNGNLLTHARYCQNVYGQVNSSCLTEPSNFRDNAVTDFASAATEYYDVGRPWHRVTHAPLHPPGIVARGETWNWNYSPASMAGLAWMPWDYRSDNTFWSSKSMLPPTPAEADCRLSGVGEGTCLDGVMWYHADTTAGRTVSTVGSLTVGLHGGDDQVANHYFPWAPDKGKMTVLKGYGLYRKLFWWQKLLGPLPYDLGLRGHVRPLGIDDDRVVHLLHDNGGGLAGASSYLSPKLADVLGQEIEMAASLEPGTAGGNLDSRIEAAILSYDGSTVLGAAATLNQRLVLSEEAGISFSSDRSEFAPTPRFGFVSFLSPALGGVVVLGGNDLSTGEATPTLHIFRNGQGWLSPTIRGTKLGAVRAAVYSPADKNIWLVDNYETGKLRIVKLNPFTGAAQVAGTYEWDEASHVRQGMGVNPNGTVLLYTSTGSTTRVASLAVVNKQLVATTLDTLEGGHAGPPATATGEYSFLSVDDSGRTKAVHRRTSLTTSANTALTEFFK